MNLINKGRNSKEKTKITKNHTPPRLSNVTCYITWIMIVPELNNFLYFSSKIYLKKKLLLSLQIIKNCFYISFIQIFLKVLIFFVLWFFMLFYFLKNEEIINRIKNDESRYGDVTTLSVFSILYAFMVWKGICFQGYWWVWTIILF